MAQQARKLPSELLREAMGVKDEKKEKEEKHLEDEFFERVLNLLTSMFTMQAMAQVMTQVLTQITISTGIVSSSIMMPIDVQGTTIMLPLDIQGTTIMLPVDIQGQVQTLDIRITGQVENVKIEIAEVAGDVVFNVQAKDGYFYIRTEEEVNITVIAPIGGAVSVQQTVSRNDYYSWEVPVGGSDTNVIALGKGRFKRLIGQIYTTSPSAYVDWRNIYIAIRADGEDRFSAGGLSICSIDEVTGALTIHSVEGKSAGETWPPYRPGRAFRIIYIKHDDITDTYEPTGITVNTFSLPFRMLAFEIEMNIEFEEKLEIEVTNMSGFSPASDIVMLGWVEWGEYL